MLVSKFSETYRLYSGFQIWEIKSMTDFFKGSEILPTIFKDIYNVSVEELEAKTVEVPDSNYNIINKLLGLVDNKSFFVFTLHDENHLDLVKMQAMKAMNFGVDIEQIKPDCVYAIIMDKMQNEN
ncbi:MAG: hypothetical protein GY810_27015 [Aureispira sp.]|nr:hypothetical protein [Aureispira sp.]